jgi:putative nucleotidyltransferase with HDIG domain
MRNALVDRERLKTAAMHEEMSRVVRWRRRDTVFLLAAVVWAFAAAFPSLYIGRPIPYVVGSIANADAYSRIDFTWHDLAAEAQAVRNLESSYARRYAETPISEWSASAHDAIDRLLAAAAAAGSAADVADAARELDIPLEAGEDDALFRGASVAKNDPNHYLVRPMVEVLERDIFPRGILGGDRFDAERGRTIQIIRSGTPHLALVGGERGPASSGQVGALLERRLRERFSVWLPDDFKTALARIVLTRLKPTLSYDQAGSGAELAERRSELLTRVPLVKKDDRLVSRGEVITIDKMGKLREEELAFRASQGWRLPVARLVGNVVLFLALALAMALYFKVAEGRDAGIRRRFFVGSLLCLLTVYIGYFLIWTGLPGTMLPIGVVAGVAALGMTMRTSIFLTAVASLISLVIFDGRPDLMVGYLTAGWFFVYMAARVRWRGLLLLMALLSGLIGSVAFIAWNFTRGDVRALFELDSSLLLLAEGGMFPLVGVLGLVANWFVSGLVVLMLLPWVERLFGVTTRIRLQDFADLDHPLLKRLIVEAPGTYHHSSVVGTLAEAAAEAVGGDGLRARIGAMFHDIGKLVKPEYFSENEAGVSRHDLLGPHMSALVIVNHVKDGAEIAKSYRLPASVVDMIQQHHGTGVMKFFHHKAVAQAPEGVEISRDAFTYPGPRPQTPEAAVVMLADAVEAAVRSLDGPSPEHIRKLVSSLSRERLLDGQFEESGLSMGQLARVEDVVIRLLLSMYHGRVKYPDAPAGNGGKKR